MKTVYFPIPITDLLSKLCVLMKILSLGSAKEKTKLLKGVKFCTSIGRFQVKGLMQESARSAILILYRVRMNNAVIKIHCVFDVFLTFVAVLKYCLFCFLAYRKTNVLVNSCLDYSDTDSIESKES